jgi:hypothetical protein
MKNLVELIFSSQVNSWIFFPISTLKLKMSFVHMPTKKLHVKPRSMGQRTPFAVNSFQTHFCIFYLTLCSFTAGPLPQLVNVLHDIINYFCLNNTRYHQRNTDLVTSIGPKKGRGKAIPVTGRGGPQGCMTSRLPHFLNNWLRDGSEVVSLTRWPPFTPQEESWYSFLLEVEPTPGPYCGWKD